MRFVAYVGRKQRPILQMYINRSMPHLWKGLQLQRGCSFHAIRYTLLAVGCAGHLQGCLTDGDIHAVFPITSFSRSFEECLSSLPIALVECMGFPSLYKSSGFLQSTESISREKTSQSRRHPEDV